MKKSDLQVRREALKLSQGQMAEALGVTRQTYGRWERGDAPPPERYRERLVDVVGVEACGIQRGLERRTHDLPAFLRDSRHRVRQAYPKAGTIDEVVRLGRQAMAIVRSAREEAGEAAVCTVLEHFARDTRYELLLILTLIAYGAHLVWTSPQRFDCPILVMDDFRCQYGGDQMQWALVWEVEGEIIVLFGQQRVKSMLASNRARVDFLVYHKTPGKRGQWMTVELDGREHETQESQDDDRAESLLIPEIRYDNQKLLSEYWFQRFQEDVRTAAVEGARREKDRNRKSDEFRRKREAEVRRRAEQMQP